jgi:sulfoxide reductase catalytic subunit YedY
MQSGRAPVTGRAILRNEAGMATNDKLGSEITPPEMYFNRRTLMRGGLIAAGMAATGLAYRKINGVDLVMIETAQLQGLTKPQEPGYVVTDEPINSREQITNYNNFYEFTTNKDGVAKAAQDFKTAGWKIEVGGLCHKPKTFDLDDIRRISPPEERIYRMRCVEAWSMVVPWAGYSLSKLLAAVEPTSDAMYVAFQTLLDPERLPNQSTNVLKWPYVEGLRIDEAMHPLALLTTGLYGRELPPQDGAPVRMIIPW